MERGENRTGVESNSPQAENDEIVGPSSHPLPIKSAKRKLTYGVDNEDEPVAGTTSKFQITKADLIGLNSEKIYLNPIVPLKMWPTDEDKEENELETSNGEGNTSTTTKTTKASVPSVSLFGSSHNDSLVRLCEEMECQEKNKPHKKKFLNLWNSITSDQNISNCTDPKLCTFLLGELDPNNITATEIESYFNDKLHESIGQKLTVFFLLEYLLKLNSITKLLELYEIIQKKSNSESSFQTQLKAMVKYFCKFKLRREHDYIHSNKIAIPTSLKEAVKPSTFNAHFEENLLENFEIYIRTIIHNDEIVNDGTDIEPGKVSLCRLISTTLLFSVINQYRTGTFTCILASLIYVGRYLPGIKGTKAYLNFIDASGVRQSLYLHDFVTEDYENLEIVPGCPTIPATQDDLKLASNLMYRAGTRAYYYDKITFGVYSLLKVLLLDGEIVLELLFPEYDLNPFLEIESKRVDLLRIFISEQSEACFKYIRSPIDSFLSFPEVYSLLSPFKEEEKVLFFFNKTKIKFYSEYNAYLMLLNWAFCKVGLEFPATTFLVVADQANEKAIEMFRSVYKECLRLIDMTQSFSLLKQGGFVEEEILDLTIRWKNRDPKLFGIQPFLRTRN